MSLKIILSGLLIASLAPLSAFADDNPDNFYCSKRNLGANFYCEPPKPKAEKEEMVPTPVKPNAPAVEPKHPDIVALEKFQKKLDETRKIAVWNPTKNNVRDYMLMQITAGSKAKDFSKTFAQLSWQEPELSHVVNSPVNAAGVTEWKATRRKAVTEHMQTLNERFGVYYFYSSECPACRVFGPVLKQFSDIHDMKVMAISMDGGGNAEFPEWRPNNGISQRLGMDGVLTPAVVLFDTKTKTGVPISYGMVSVQDLENRIFILTGKEKPQPTFTGGFYDR